MHNEIYRLHFALFFAKITIRTLIRQWADQRSIVSRVLFLTLISQRNSYFSLQKTQAIPTSPDRGRYHSGQGRAAL